MTDFMYSLKIFSFRLVIKFSVNLAFYDLVIKILSLKCSLGRTVAQAVSFRLPTAADRVHVRAVMWGLW
jgi:hypothetical protein